MHNDYKEFFDRPIDYDVRGYNYTMRPNPMMVYEDAKGRPDIVRPRFDEKKKKQLAKRISREKSKTSREKLLLAQTGKNWKISTPGEYGLSSNGVFSTFLRHPDPSGQEKNVKKKENRWNQRFAIPVSTYNEAVFRKYRVSFEQL